MDENTSLTEIKNFTHLNNQVSESVANTVNSFGLVENNYVAAISLLNESYGGYDMFVHAHLSNLVNMKGLKSSFDTGGFRNLYDKGLVQIQNLESLGVKPDTYNRLLCL